jgi:large subunit ribosomal protein L31
MKKDIHPKSYKNVVFLDVNTNFGVLTRSTVDLGAKPEMTTWEDGNEYPVIKVQTSSSSHNFYTGKKIAMDELGTIAKFHAKYSKKK